MSKYYCHDCALAQKVYAPIVDYISLTGTQYQLEKFIKHTAPITLSGIVSVFDDPRYIQYKHYTVNTSASGSVEIDNQGRTNIVWYAGNNIGVTYQNGLFVTTTDTVKVVFNDNEFKIHAFSVDSFKYEKKKCENCGRDILY
jgi:hypothetical protein